MSVRSSIEPDPNATLPSLRLTLFSLQEEREDILDYLGRSPGIPTQESDPLCSKRCKFFEAAEPLFERFGFRKTTVEDVCRTAGMSKRTFYDLFASKQDLLVQLVEAVINQMTHVWEANLSPDMDPLQRLQSLLDFYARMVREHRFMQALVEDLDLMRTFGQRAEELRLCQMGGTLDKILQDGVATGQFRAINTRAAVSLVFSLLDTVYLLMPTLMNVPGPTDDPILSEATKQFILRGLGAVEESDSEQVPRRSPTRRVPGGGLP